MNESYFCAFMLALGISEVSAGLNLVMAQFIGVVLQFISIRPYFRQKSLTERLTLFLILQGLAMLPLILIGSLKLSDGPLITIILGLYWWGLLSLNPPWNKLMGHTIPVAFRLKFFSIRNQFSQISVFLGLILSGSLLHVFGKTQELKVFTCLLMIGLGLKLASIWEIRKKHIHYVPTAPSEDPVPFTVFLKRLRSTDQGQLIGFLFFFYVTVHIAAPFFTPYMLGPLRFNYLEFMIVIACSYVGRVTMFRILQKKAKAHQMDFLFILSTVGISLSPVLWSLSTHYGWIMGVEFWSGCCWAGFELSTIMLFFQNIEDRERTSIMTYCSFFNISGMALGSLLGAVLMKSEVLPADKYPTLFMISSGLRISVALFGPALKRRGQIPVVLKTSWNSSTTMVLALYVKVFRERK